MVVVTSGDRVVVHVSLVILPTKEVKSFSAIMFSGLLASLPS